MFYIMFEGEGVVENDSKVTTVGGWRHGGVINVEAEAVGCFVEGFGAYYVDVGFSRYPSRLLNAENSDKYIFIIKYEFV